MPPDEEEHAAERDQAQGEDLTSAGPDERALAHREPAGRMVSNPAAR